MYGPQVHGSLSPVVFFLFGLARLLLLATANVASLLRRLAAANVVDTEKQACRLKAVSMLCLSKRDCK
jgi:hypothetical protein